MKFEGSTLPQDLLWHLILGQSRIQTLLGLDPQQAEDLTEDDVIEWVREFGDREPLEQALAAAGRSITPGSPVRSGILTQEIEWVECESWDQFIEAVRVAGEKPVPYFYRGQGSAEWLLQSEIERMVAKARFSPNGQGFYDLARSVFLDQFVLEAAMILGRAPESMSASDWWTLGRHHGLITPLLDWTESPYVAAFFAFIRPRRSPRRASRALPKWRVRRTKAESLSGACEPRIGCSWRMNSS